MTNNVAFEKEIKRFDDERTHRNEKKGRVFALITKALKGRIFWIRLLNALILSAIALFVLTACAGKCELKEVLVPTKCPVSPKPRPIFTGDVVSDLKQTLIYTELLEADLKVCLGDATKKEIR